MLYYSLGIYILSLLILGFLVIAVWNIRLKTDIGTYRRLRSFAAFRTPVHAVVSIYRLSVEIAIPRTLEKPFVPELLGYLVFWVLVPPVWFFFEYFAVASDAIAGYDSSEQNLKRVKDYADFASKIWAAVVAVLLFLVTLK